MEMALDSLAMHGMKKPRKNPNQAFIFKQNLKQDIDNKQRPTWNNLVEHKLSISSGNNQGLTLFQTAVNKEDAKKVKKEIANLKASIMLKKKIKNKEISLGLFRWARREQKVG